MSILKPVRAINNSTVMDIATLQLSQKPTIGTENTIIITPTWTGQTYPEAYAV
jgi:hypothetical protein